MKTLLLIGLAAGLAFADVEERDTQTRSFPGGRLVIVDNVFGSIEVTGYDGADVQVEVERWLRAETEERRDTAKREVKLDMQQTGDTVKLFLDGPFRCNCSEGHRGVSWRGHQGYRVRYDFKIRVPRQARLDLYTVNDGHITVANVNGDFDIGNVNGRIELTEISGSGRAKTVNGKMLVTYARNPSGASSFETLNGNVDISFRPGIAADVTMSTFNGGMYTDFQAQPLNLPMQAMTERRGMKTVYSRDRGTGIRIGSGGQELKLKTFNGDIYIRSR